MNWIVAGMLGAIGLFIAFVWIHGPGYDEGFQDGKSFQARQQAYETPLPMPGMQEMAQAQPEPPLPPLSTDWIDKLEQEINGR